MKWISYTRSAVALAGALVLASVHALEVEPGDAIAPPPGVSAVGLYLIDQRLSGAYVGGNKVADNGLHAQIGVLRVLHSTTVAGFHVNPQFALPVGRLEGREGLAGIGSANGIGDLYTGASIMLKEDPATRTSVYVLPAVTFRTGHYDPTQLSIGNNRMAYMLQVGGQTALSKSFTVDGYAEVTAYGNNKDYRGAGAARETLSQKSVALLQSYLRYDLGEGNEVAVGARHYAGGAKHVDARLVEGNLGRTTMVLTASRWIEPTLQLMASYQRDAHVDNGLRTKNLFQLRLLKAFP